MFLSMATCALCANQPTYRLVSENMKRNRFSFWALVWVLCSNAGIVFAGPFANIGLKPFSLTGGAPPDTGLTEMEPSTAVIFSPTPAGFDAASNFVKWASAAGAGVACPKFGIAVLGTEDQPDVVSEALVQRQIAMPVFYTTKDKAGYFLPPNVHGRVVVVSGGIVNGTSFDALTTAASQAIALSSSSLPGKLLATPAPTVQPGTKEILPGVSQAPTTPPTTTGMASVSSPTVTMRTGIYTNMQFGMRAAFPSDISWRESRRGDGAVSSQDSTKLVWRVWCSPNNVNKDGQPGRMSALEYVRRLITLTASRLGTQPSFDKRFEVNEGNAVGRDYTYTITPKNGTKVSGRVQAFEAGDYIKAASVEGPSDEFFKRSKEIETFFESFTTQPAPEEAQNAQTGAALPPDGATAAQQPDANTGQSNVPIILPPQQTRERTPNSFDFFD